MIARRPPTVLVAMSGGVDSSVAAALLAEQGFEVVGATLKLWCYGEGEAAPRACCSLEAIADARAVALRLGFAHFVLDYSDEFRRRVAEPFVAGYLAGRTPYPCAACNADLKLGRLVEQARGIGARFVATGHYARRGSAPLPGGGEEPALRRARGREKDQSYALWAVARETLDALLLPLGELTKEEVRGHARRLGLERVAGKWESQDLCFVGAGGHARFVAEQAGRERAERPGPILDREGRELGRHRGLAHYTVGQRRGLGREAAAGGPHYVIALDAERNAVTVGPEEALLGSEARTARLHWLSAAPPRAGRRLEAQIRYRAAAAPASLWPREEADEGAPFDPAGGARVVFDTPQRAITPGQSVVLYDGDRLLGGGAIL